MRGLLVSLLAAACLAGVGIAADHRHHAQLLTSLPAWHSETATAYATFEHLTGCTSPGRCGMSCGGYLNDRVYTVARNYRVPLQCGARIVVCGHGCATATVTDRTLSGFGFEFSYALALATGQTRASWDSPRTVRWRRAG